MYQIKMIELENGPEIVIAAGKAMGDIGLEPQAVEEKQDVEEGWR